MHAAEALLLDPAGFEAAFRTAHGIEDLEEGDRAEWFRRVRQATNYIDKGADAIRRGQEQLDSGIRERAELDNDAPPDADTLHNGTDHPDLIHDVKPKRNIINWAELANQTPPPFDWLMEHWLSWDPTGLWGRGGVGKSLLVQQIATGLATARPLWSTLSRKVRVLCWFCEDKDVELWRRQDRICKQLGIGFDQLDNLIIDARCGMENAIFTTEYGKPMWTPLYQELRQQLNDFNADVLFLDNIAQTFGGNVNDQHHVTTFTNGINGAVTGRNFCPVFVGHVAKIKGSEFAGNMAWENSVRMRWFLSDKLPEEEGADPAEPGAEGSDSRFLCKRKTNYARTDWLQFNMEQGIFAPVKADITDDGGTLSYLRKQRIRTVVLQAVKKLASMGIACSDSKGSNYLPSKIVEMKLGEDASKAEIRAAMNALMLDGELVRSQVGTYSKGAPKFGLVAPPKT